MKAVSTKPLRKHESNGRARSGSQRSVGKTETPRGQPTWVELLSKAKDETLEAVVCLARFAGIRRPTPRNLAQAVEEARDHLDQADDLYVTVEGLIEGNKYLHKGVRRVLAAVLHDVLWPAASFLCGACDAVEDKVHGPPPKLVSRFDRQTGLWVKVRKR